METLFVFLNLQYNSKSFYVQAIYNWLLEIELFKTKKTTTTTTTAKIQIALRWLDWIFLGGYLPSLSINYVATSKDMEKRLPELYYIKKKICYDLGFIAIGVAIAT